jgi:hypothetical protein
MFYVVQSCFTDTGKTSARVFEVPDNTPKPENVSGETIDIYFDVFETMEEADRFALEVLEA